MSERTGKTATTATKTTTSNPTKSKTDARDTAIKRPAGLNPTHFKMLSEFRITPATMELARIKSATDAEVRAVGITGATKKDLSGLLIPSYELTIALGGPRAWRVRRDNPDEKKDPKTGRVKIENKYIGTVGYSGLYYLPGTAEKLTSDPTTKIILVEAEKSVWAVTDWAARMKLNAVVIGMRGCWGWSKDKRPDESLVDICADTDAEVYRTVVIMLDKNLATSVRVQTAHDTLTRMLPYKCTVITARLHASMADGTSTEFNGPDDLLALPEGDAWLLEIYDTASPSQAGAYGDDALARRMAREYADLMQYFSGDKKGQWLVWDGQVWQRDSEKAAYFVSEFTMRTAKECSPSKAERIRGTTTINNIRTAASRLPQFRTRAEDWDNNTLLVPTKGGTFDVETGKFFDNRPEDRFTKIFPTTPDMEKKPTQWLKFLEEITLGNKDLQAYLKRLIGYCLTGDTREQAFFFLKGEGGNGKGVFIHTLEKLFGSGTTGYSTDTAVELFIHTHNGPHPAEMAKLVGARLAVVPELEDGQRWAEARIKAFTGGDRLTANPKYADPFDFQPQFKPILTSNYEMKLRNVDVAMRRRFQYIPFDAKFMTAAEINKQVKQGLAKRGEIKLTDTKLEEKLMSELGAIMWWAMEGAREWLRGGLNPPEIVLARTEQYMEEQDTIGVWLGEATITTNNPNDKTIRADLYRHYKSWCELGKQYALDSQRFATVLRTRGYAEKSVGGGKTAVLGIVLHTAKFEGLPASVKVASITTSRRAGKRT